MRCPSSCHGNCSAFHGWTSGFASRRAALSGHRCCFSCHLPSPLKPESSLRLQSYPLPELRNGDWLAFPDMGAYTLCGASNFNGINAADVLTFYVHSLLTEA